MFTVQGLTKRYGSNLAVENLSFGVPDGKVTGFLGPNGSGKSTTMRCMLGLDTPTSGKAIVTHGQFQGAVQDSKQKAQLVGALLDASWVDPKRSARNHLRMLARGAGISDTRVDECLDLVGLSSKAKAKVGGFSLGMRQRLGVASALLGDPQHLLFDEPVNGLDPEGVSWMRQTIRYFASEGRSVLVSSHLLAEMQQTADRLVIIGRGKLIGEYDMADFLGGGLVEIETPHSEFADVLKQHGFKPTPIERGFHVPVEGEEQAAREQIARLALEHKVLLTGLKARSAGLEERFLQATMDDQEYRSK
ncbi:ABC transporter ATP-binding protein [Corynebacterium gerontici]|uniref:Putative ABC transporter ATP-binding protein YxlF n=1 Tax=Corynebacterium gerontici TaxID=2079234 RepID=A0A3G6J2N1_9CORY|nr:ABC transporter ATP-binding protein [Corynebacterium gerontici]AZA12166.1 putative ABC transporter ATP-binding protein YxlF [Corynebacterium gerontici]